MGRPPGKLECSLQRSCLGNGDPGSPTSRFWESTMAEQQSSTAEDITGLTRGIVDDVQKLIGQHIDLLRSEVKEGMGQARDAALAYATGAGLGAAGGLLAALGAVRLLHALTGLPL